MANEYFIYYLLSYFDLEKGTTASQIGHVFHGKRTPSMFYLIEKRKWHHGFLLTNRLTKEKIQKIIDKLTNNRFLRAEEKGFLLTEKGLQACQEYFNTHYFPQNIHSFSNSTIRLPFWNRYQLFTQVFSELSYNQSKYIPIVKDPKHQENVRQLLKSVHSDRESLTKQWIKEQTLIFKQLEKDSANILANQLTGHAIIGKTRAQISSSRQMNQMGFSFYLLDAIEELLGIIQSEKENLPLTFEILNVLKEERHLGLSASTYQSYTLLKKGYSLKQIASSRFIKVNTVREHILEMAFILDDFPYQTFVPETIYQKLYDGFETQEAYRFQQATNDIEALEFMHYRLVELERLRAK